MYVMYNPIAVYILGFNEIDIGSLASHLEYSSLILKLPSK